MQPGGGTIDSDDVGPDRFLVVALAIERGERAGQALIVGAKARALLDGRAVASPDDIRAVALPVLTAALFTRFRSRETNPFAERLLAALRNQFGGHPVKKRDA